MTTIHDAYDELYVYAMGHGDPSFILQHVVDANAAQTAAAGDKPIRLVFALIGLYLHVERGFSGRQVQLAHMRLGACRKRWPVVPLPPNRGAVTAVDVAAVPPGSGRDAAIDEWCRSTWAAFDTSRETIVDLLRAEEIV